MIGQNQSQPQAKRLRKLKGNITLPINPAKEKPQALFADFVKVGDEDSMKKILMEMVNPDPERIDTKTEIPSPLNLTLFTLMGEMARNEGMNEVADMFDKTATVYKTYMISHDRKSRNETYRAIAEGFKEERTLAQKMMSKPTVGN